MKHVFVYIPMLICVAGCAQLGWPGKTAPQSAPTEAPETAQPAPEVAPVPPAARTVEQFDTTTQAQRAKAAAGGQSGGGRNLGVTIASLGSPSEPGFWLKTPLVDAPAKGRVVYPQTGKSAQVDLIPIDGPKTAGSRMSLSAMRLIGAPFTGLPEVQVIQTGS